VLDYESTLELLDEEGKYARFEKQKKVNDDLALQVDVLKLELKEKIETNEYDLGLKVDDLKVRLENELKIIEGIPEAELGKELIEAHKKEMLALKAEVIKVNDELIQLKLRAENVDMQTQKLKEDMKNSENLLSEVALLEDTEGAISDTLFIVNRSGKDFATVDEINHNKKPLVFLYDNQENQIIKETMYLDEIIDSVIVSVFRTNDFKSIKLTIIDIVTGSKNFLGPRYTEFLTVIDKNTDIKKHAEQIEKLAKTIAASPEGDIISLNRTRYANGDPIDPFFVTQIVIPPIDSTNSEFQAPEEFWKASKEGDKYGFMPIFYVSKQDWENFRNGANDSKHRNNLSGFILF